MTEIPTPNVFSFATSELSQDAFICWLLSWSQKELAAVDENLHQTAILFLHALLGRCGTKLPGVVDKLEIQRQRQGIDILALVNDDIALLIEDKTYTKDHSDQLNRYLAAVRRDFPQREVAAIYFKTGDQSNYKAAEAARYATFLRKDILKVLMHGKQLGVTNNVFTDFHRHVQSIEEGVHSYLTLPIEKWHHGSWTGFFIELQSRLGHGEPEGEWGYVPNRSGGFMGFWWHWKANRYLQLEERSLCFKIEVKDKGQRADKWKKWNDALLNASAEGVFRLKGPSRRRNGTWMTVAHYDGDYLQAKEGGMLDLDGTIQVLREAEHFLDDVVKKHG